MTVIRRTCVGLLLIGVFVIPNHMGAKLAAQRAAAPAGLETAAPAPAVIKLPKLTGPVRAMVSTAAERGATAARSLVDAAHLLAADGRVRVLVELAAADEAVRTLLSSLGGTVEIDLGLKWQALLPIDQLAPLAASDAVVTIGLPAVATPAVTTSEGVETIGASDLHIEGVSGAGVKIAVLDLGFEGHAALLGSELPAAAVLKSFRSDGDITGGGEKHGTAVAEIVHDVAPNASLYLANFSTAPEMTRAVDWLIAQKVQVVNASFGYTCAGPLDGTSEPSRDVARARNAGVLWVNAAGNSADKHWTGVYQDGDGNGWHNFAGTDEGNTFYLNYGQDVTICIQWDDWQARTQDYDLYLYGPDNSLIAASEGMQNGSLEPAEAIRITAPTSGDYSVRIRRYSANRAVRFHLIIQEPGAGCAIETAVARYSSDLDPVVANYRRFRDETARRESRTAGLVALYDEHSPEVRWLALRHPDIGLAIARLVAAGDPFVNAMTGSRTTELPLGAAIRDQAMTLIGRLEQTGSAGLQRSMRAISDRLAAIPEQATVDDYWLAMANLPLASSSDGGEVGDVGDRLQYLDPTTSISVPADTAAAFTVGAVNVDTDTLEKYSSQGPNAAGLRKPDISAPARVCTVTYGNCYGSGFPGTSAAAPHVAGAAALIWERLAGATPATVQTWLEGKALDLNGGGPDNQLGWGRLSVSSQPPKAPVLFGPQGNIGLRQVPYRWRRNPRTTWYYLWVRDRSGDVLVRWYTAASAGCANVEDYCEVTPGVSLAPGGVTWWVLPWNAAGGDGPWSEPLVFTVTTPGAALLVAPSGNAKADGRFTWQAESLSTWYRLWINDARGKRFDRWYTAKEAGCDNGQLCSVTPNVPLLGASIWWIQTYNAVGDGLWSQEKRFTPTDPAGDVIRLYPPGDVFQGGQLRLWAHLQNVGSAAFPADARVRFWVQLADPWVGSVSVAGLAPSTPLWYYADWRTPNNLPRGTYQYWAQIWTNQGPISTWAGPETFVVR